MNIRPIPTSSSLIRAVIEAAKAQDRMDDRRLAEMRAATLALAQRQQEAT